jgi:hypothetical protein
MTAMQVLGFATHASSTSRPWAAKGGPAMCPTKESAVGPWRRWLVGTCGLGKVSATALNQSAMSNKDRPWWSTSLKMAKVRINDLEVASVQLPIPSTTANYARITLCLVLLEAVRNGSP